MIFTRFIVYVILTMAFLQGCKKSETPVVAVDPPTADTPTQKTFLALGDSYTIGQGTQPADRFPTQTQQWLKAEGINMTDPKYLATTGWTTSDLSAAITSTNLTGVYNVVTLLIGVNDQYLRHDTSGYRERFTGLLNTSIGFAGRSRNHVFVLSIPDYSVTPASNFSDTAFIRKQVEMFSKINREVTEQNFCNYLDITPSTREASYDRTLIAADSLHPSGKEYSKWAARLGPMMKVVLK